tara:strand:- start:334 stop:519 length:186 start_codon:yes stop_codon:yes gene_type:complete
MDTCKIKTFDKYIMSGGDQSLQNIEDLIDYGFHIMQLKYESNVFDDVVIDVIRKLTGDLKK